MPSISVKKQFSAPVTQVFNQFSRHDSYQLAFAPLQVECIQLSQDVQYPHGLDSVRALGWGKVKPLKEKIITFQPSTLIEYQVMPNPLLKSHFGQIQFEALTEHSTLVTYRIDFEMRVAWLDKILAKQLQGALKIGLAKLAKSFA